MAIALKLQDVKKSFKGVNVINGLNLEVEEGHIQVVIGPNGAGKSTMFALISGLIPPTSGQIHLGDQKISGMRPFEICRMGLARSFQVTNIFSSFTVRDNIKTSLLWTMNYRHKLTCNLEDETELDDRTDEILDEVGLFHLHKVVAGTLSYADQRMLEIGVTLAANPRIILLDEPTAGMSHSESKSVIRLLRKISAQRTLLIIEHDMQVVMELANRIAVLVYGQVIANDEPHAIRSNAAVKSAYLGEEKELHAAR